MPAHEIHSGEGLHPPDGVDAAAVLVIHGIGEQAPYQTLDAFVQGLASEFGIHAKQLEHRLVKVGDGTCSVIRMPLPRPAARCGARVLDFYEFHWAGMVEGGINLRQVLWWLVRTALSPIRLWAQQAIILIRTHESSGARGGQLLRLFVSEVMRSILLLLAAVALVAPFLYTLSHPNGLFAAWDGMKQAVAAGENVTVLSLVVLILVVVIAALRGAVSLLRQWADGMNTERAVAKWWAKASILTAAALVVLGLAADQVFGLHGARVVGTVVRAAFRWQVLWPIVTLAIGVWLGKVLVSYLGDVALYTTADENSIYYRTRMAILEKSTALVRYLCEHKGYCGVYLAGHSLGSVIAYDTINRYVKDVRSGCAPAGEGDEMGLGRLRGLLTFGSPLDAVYYLFRTEVGAGEPVRAQILSSLHGFRKQSSGRDYGRLAFAPYEVPRLPLCRWLNVYSRTDLISRRLIFYEVDEQARCFYPPWNPARAHLAYWNDRKFYAMVSQWL